MQQETIVHVDGASKGNPGDAASAFVALNPDGSKFFFALPIGETTNNTAEYVAVLLALRYCLARKIRNVTIKSDSELVIRQLNGQYKVKQPHLIRFYNDITVMKTGFERISFVHVPREENRDADYAANEAIFVYHLSESFRDMGGKG